MAHRIRQSPQGKRAGGERVVTPFTDLRASNIANYSKAASLKTMQSSSLTCEYSDICTTDKTLQIDTVIHKPRYCVLIVYNLFAWHVSLQNLLKVLTAIKLRVTKNTILYFLFDVNVSNDGYIFILFGVSQIFLKVCIAFHFHVNSCNLEQIENISALSYNKH